MKISEPDKEDLSRVRDIADRQLGEAYTYDFDKFLKTSRTVFKVAKIEKEVVGYAVGHNLDQEEIEEKIEHIEEVNTSGSYFESVAVKEKFQGQGIGTSLSSNLIEELNNPVYCLSWVRDGKKDSRELMKKLGFKRVKKEEEFWYEESIGKQNYCPDCGSPCRCAAALFVLE